MMKGIAAGLGLALMVSAWSGAAFASERADGGTGGEPSCEGIPGADALDFWLGDWSVRAGDQEVGTNHVVKVMAGCAIEEHWTDAQGHRGRSLFYFVPAAGQWRQVWVTENAASPGGVKEKRLTEHFEDGGVRFQGEVLLEGGRTYLDRTTLTPADGGRVRQHIEISTDGGETWRTTFDAVYVPAPGVGLEPEAQEAPR